MTVASQYYEVAEDVFLHIVCIAHAKEKLERWKLFGWRSELSSYNLLRIVLRPANACFDRCNQSDYEKMRN